MSETNVTRLPTSEYVEEWEKFYDMLMKKGFSEDHEKDPDRFVALIDDYFFMAKALGDTHLKVAVRPTIAVGVIRRCLDTPETAYEVLLEFMRALRHTYYQDRLSSRRGSE